MKNRLFLLLLTGIILSSCSKVANRVAPNPSVSSLPGKTGNNTDPSIPPPANLPIAVQHAFKTHFPAASGSRWEETSYGAWYVQFLNRLSPWEAVFKADGDLLSSGPL